VPPWADPTPGTHRVSSLVKRWLAGSHQSAVTRDHLQSYLNEFVFRFNRRHSRSRGLLFLRLLEASVEAPPRTYRSFVANPRPLTAAQRAARVPPPADKRSAPASLDIEAADRPWRTPG